MANELMKRLDNNEPPPHVLYMPADEAAAVSRMAAAGQALALRWGHEPWSDSWARLVAETLLAAAKDAPAQGEQREH